MSGDIEFKIEIPNLDGLMNAFKQAPDIAKPTLDLAFLNAQVALANNTNQNTVPYRTTNLIKSFMPEFEPLTLKWFPTAKYAKAVEFGMPASQGRYVPAIGKRLKNNLFGDKWFGSWPGFSGNPYMERIVDAAQPRITEIFAEALQIITDKIANA